MSLIQKFRISLSLSYCLRSGKKERKRSSLTSLGKGRGMFLVIIKGVSNMMFFANCLLSLQADKVVFLHKKDICFKVSFQASVSGRQCCGTTSF